MSTQDTAQGAPIVILTDGIPTTTTLTIATGAKAEHASVIKLVRTYQADLEEFGEVRFEIRLNQQGSPTEFATLNEQQTSLLFTYMRNSAIVRAFKKRLIKEFYELARSRAMPNPEPQSETLSEPQPKALPSGYFPRTRLLLTLEEGQVVRSKPVPENACVIDPTSRTDMETLFREFVPGELMPGIMKICADRLAYLARNAFTPKAA